MNYIFDFLFYFIIFIFFDILLFKNKEKVNDPADSTAAIRKIIVKDLGEGKTPTVLLLTYELMWYHRE